MGVVSDAIDAIEDWCCDLFKDGIHYTKHFQKKSALQSQYPYLSKTENIS